MANPAIDLIGTRYDKLLVIAALEMTPSGRKWLVQCDCGERLIKFTTQIRRLNPKSKTGCRSCERQSRSDAHTVHGDSKDGKKTPLFNLWKGMRKRCSNPNDISWRYYGAKGVAVDPRWDDFAVFKEWAMSQGYVPGLSIDRLDAARHYCPENCEIVTRSENSRRACASRRKAA